MAKESSRFSASRMTSRSESLPIKMPTLGWILVTFNPSGGAQFKVSRWARKTLEIGQCSISDVFTVVHTLPGNFADRAIGLFHGRGNRAPASRHSEHAPSGR